VIINYLSFVSVAENAKHVTTAGTMTPVSAVIASISQTKREHKSKKVATATRTHNQRPARQPPTTTIMPIVTKATHVPKQGPSSSSHSSCDTTSNVIFLLAAIAVVYNMY
jgi:hypothetical protein